MSDFLKDFDRLVSPTSGGLGMLGTQEKILLESNHELVPFEESVDPRDVPSARALAQMIRKAAEKDPKLLQKLRSDAKLETEEERVTGMLKTLATAGAAVGAAAYAMGGSTSGAILAPLAKVGLISGGSALVPVILYVLWRRLKNKIKPLVYDIPQYDKHRYARSGGSYYEAVGDAPVALKAIDTVADELHDVLRDLSKHLTPEERQNMDSPATRSKLRSLASRLARG